MLPTTATAPRPPASAGYRGRWPECRRPSVVQGRAATPPLFVKGVATPAEFSAAVTRSTRPMGRVPRTARKSVVELLPTVPDNNCKTSKVPAVALARSRPGRRRREPCAERPQSKSDEQHCSTPQPQDASPCVRRSIHIRRPCLPEPRPFQLPNALRRERD